jgi:hypothetical protein
MKAYQVREILENVKYLDWIFFVGEKTNGDPDYLQLQFIAPCTTNGDIQDWNGRKWKLSSFMTRSEIVTTAFKAVITALEHEAREKFKYKGQPIFGPHIDVEQLVTMYEGGCEVILDVRKEQRDDTRTQRGTELERF